jgi:BlaI family transcriptional regulator, penicillinase repressor
VNRDTSEIRRAEIVAGPDKLRRSFLELAPLELDCMNALWALGQGTVRDIRDRLAAHRPRAYTTIMTIMDRLARKGIVGRRKAGRAYLYIPNLSEDAARTHALGQVVQNFFGGSTEALLSQLQGASLPERRGVSRLMLETLRASSSPPPAPIAEAEVKADTPDVRLDETLL